MSRKVKRRPVGSGRRSDGDPLGSKIGATNKRKPLRGKALAVARLTYLRCQALHDLEEVLPCYCEEAGMPCEEGQCRAADDQLNQIKAHNPELSDIEARCLNVQWTIHKFRAAVAALQALYPELRKAAPAAKATDE